MKESGVLRSGEGSALLVVLIVLAMLLLAGTAALSIALQSHKTATVDYQTQQAYFTARSAVLAAVDTLKTSANPKALLEALDGRTSLETDGGSRGRYRLTVKRLDASLYQLAAQSDLRGVTGAYYSVVRLGDEGGALPFTGLITLTAGSGSGRFDNNAKFVGDLYLVKGSATDILFLDVTGDLYLKGNFPAGWLNQFAVRQGTGADGKPRGGNVYVYGSAAINGQIYIDNVFYAQGGVTIGNINVTKFNFIRSASFQNNQNSSFRGTWSPLTEELPPLPMETAEEVQNALIEPPATIPPELPAYRLTTYNGQTVRMITGSGTLNSAFLCPQPWDTSFRSFVFDTAAGDLHLRLSPGSYSYTGACNIGSRDMRVIGENRVYLYLDGVTLTLNDGERTVFGDSSVVPAGYFNGSMLTPLAPPRMTIIASDNSRIVTTGSRTLISAYVYMPKGGVRLTNDAYFCGSLVASDIDVRSQCRLVHIPLPDGVGGLPGGKGGGTGSGALGVVGYYSGLPAR